MIAIKELTETINKALNILASGNDCPFVFAIQSEGGEYMPPVRKGNDVTVYINGITSIASSEVIHAQGISVSTQTVQLKLSYPLPDDERIENAIAPVRQILNDYFQTATITTMQDDKDQAVTVSMYATIPSTGEIALSTGPGLMCTFSCYLYYNFIENGVNSGNCIIKFEGDVCPYTDATITRVPVDAANPYSDTNGAVQSVTESTAFNVEFSAPTLQAGTSALFAAYKTFLLTGENAVHNVIIRYENKDFTYRMKFGQSSLSLEGVKNGNSRITLVEAREFGKGE